MTSNLSSRDKILNKLRDAKEQRSVDFYAEPNWDEDIVPVPHDLINTFKKELEQINGEVFFGESEEELVDIIQGIVLKKKLNSVFCKDEYLIPLLAKSLIVDSEENNFLDLKVSVTRCEQLVARTGSVFVSSAHDSGRRLNVFPEIHVVWANASQLVPMIGDAIKLIKERYNIQLPSQITSITGPSRTADIEKTLVLGAHGPRELIVLINQNA